MCEGVCVCEGVYVCVCARACCCVCVHSFLPIFYLKQYLVVAAAAVFLKMNL